MSVCDFAQFFSTLFDFIGLCSTLLDIAQLFSILFDFIGILSLLPEINLTVLLSDKTRTSFDRFCQTLCQKNLNLGISKI